MRQYNNIIMNTDNIIQLYKEYKQVGGFGVFTLDDLIYKSINESNIQTLLRQEQKLIELYHVTYNTSITQGILETYLGRKRVNVYTRINYHMNERFRLSGNTQNVDVYTKFMQNNSMNGYMCREYWKESELMKKELSC